jgi:hypothetical protein
MFVSPQAPLLAKNARNGAPSRVLRVQVYSCSEQEVGHPAGIIDEGYAIYNEVRDFNNGDCISEFEIGQILLQQ